MASKGHVALVLTVSFLLAALSGEAYSSISQPPKSSIAQPPKSSIAGSPKASIAGSPKASTSSAGAPSPSSYAPKAQPYASIATSPKASAPSPSPSSVSGIASSPDSAPAPYVESDLFEDEPVDDYQEDTTSEVQKRKLTQENVQKVTAVLNAKIVAGLNLVETFSRDIINKRMSDATTKEDAKKCLDLCKEVYEDAVEDIKKAYTEVEERDWASAKVDFTAFSTDIQTCQDCFVEMEVKDSEIEKFEKSARGIASDCLKALESM